MTRKMTTKSATKVVPKKKVSILFVLVFAMASVVTVAWLLDETK